MVALTALSPAQHKLLEHPSVPSIMRSLASNGKLKSRKAPLYSPVPHQLVAHYKDVSHLMRTGHATWYGGVKPWSMAIRMGTQSMVSHAGTIIVQDDVFNIDTCEAIGCRKRPLKDLVKAEHGQNWHSGQWYWAPIAEEYINIYDEEAALEFALSMVGAPYGHLAILFVAASLMPVCREILFLRCGESIEKDWKKIVPYCSIQQNLIATKGSKKDPCPGRSLQLTTPQDTWQSLFWGPKVALIP